MSTNTNMVMSTAMDQFMLRKICPMKRRMKAGMGLTEERKRPERRMGTHKNKLAPQMRGSILRYCRIVKS